MEEFEYEIEDVDPSEIDARERLVNWFDKNRGQVFYSRQLEVMFENEFFHWVTNRALRGLLNEGLINSSSSQLSHGTKINIYWDRRNRYFTRATKKLIEIVEAYANPSISKSLGLQGEYLVLEGFTRRQFEYLGRNVNGYALKLL